MDIKNQIKCDIEALSLDGRINYINDIKLLLHECSPFKSEPVDCVLRVKNELVYSNQYNPNSVAPPEMELLEVSIMNDGYTQPIVSWKDQEKYEIVDGFHRNRVGKESKIVNKRVLGYLPIVNIRTEQSGKSNRMASTIRHNRARGKHQVDAMSEIILELKNRNWKNSKIARELGMDEEEILRLCQITGLQDIFKDSDFSRSWNAEDSKEGEYQPIDDSITEEEYNKYRFTNTEDENRIFHTHDLRECHKAGFYASKKDGMTNNECEQVYYNILSDTELFGTILEKVINNWKFSCEHYLTNTSMNRIAWLGQASVCYHAGVPSKYCGGFGLLSKQQQDEANNIAHKYLNIWLKSNNRQEITIEEALSIGRQVNIY